MNIREATSDDFAAIWPIFEDIVSQGVTYAYPRDTTRADAERSWMTNPRVTFVAEDAGVIVGTYFLKTNQDGPGDHVCNCGYMVAAEARGAGVASALCTHSQQVARELGYAAMQFNFVAATNAGAVRLWQKLGFEIVGTLPGAFRHPELGYVDAYVMYKWLRDD
ncbi:MAG: N-acetyltransferase [Pseudomonadota bacterium]